MKRNILLIIIAMAFCVFLTYSQTRKERVRIARAQINTLLASYADGPYTVGAIIDVDSSVGVRKVADGKITNAYGTLNRCYLFLARTQGEGGKHTIGGYRDNQIAWMSEQLPSSQDYGDLDEGFLATKDLNRMGKTDIVVYFSDGTNPPSGYYLWIFTWDGSQGVCINKQETNGGTSIASTGAFDIIDVDGDGIDEIISFGSNNNANSAFSWNGSLYGVWADSPNIVGRSYTISNNLTAIVKSSVQRVGEEFRYSYEVTNNNNSNQKIESFCIQASIDTVDSVKVPTGWQGGQWAGYPLVNCFTENENLQIETGHSLRTFCFDCLDLPVITAFYVQGHSYSLDNSTSDPDTLMEVAYNNVLNNSFIGKTIGPTQLLSPFVPLNFLDTLTSYTTQSRTLGWIKDQPTVDKYLGYFVSAKTNLQQNNIGTTRTTLQRVLQDANTDSTNLLTSEAYALIRYNTEYLLSQLPAPIFPSITSISPTTAYAGSASFTLTVNGKNFVSGSAINWNNSTRTTTFIADSILQAGILTSDIAVIDSPLVTVQNPDGGESNSVRFYVKSQPQVSGCNVKLINSTGTKLTGGALQYYEGRWKDAVNNNDGTFFINTTKTTLGLRMTYEYGTQTKSNVTVGYDTVVFQTVNAKVQLQNSSGAFIDTGLVQYYARAWRNLGTTTNGTAAKELLPANYSFRMTYAYASKDKQQDIETNATVVFQTVNAAVQLKNSHGNLIDQGTVQYYSGAWRSLGTTTNGIATKELLPNNYSFRMTYEYVSVNKAQDISTNNTVGFSTVLCTVRVKNSRNQPVNGAQASYYSGAWRQIGTTVNGEVTKELLPANLSFRVTYGTQQRDKQQNLSKNNVVKFTVR